MYFGLRRDGRCVSGVFRYFQFLVVFRGWYVVGLRGRFFDVYIFGRAFLILRELCRTAISGPVVLFSRSAVVAVSYRPRIEERNTRSAYPPALPHAAVCLILDISIQWPGGGWVGVRWGLSRFETLTSEIGAYGEPGISLGASRVFTAPRKRRVGGFDPAQHSIREERALRGARRSFGIFLRFLQRLELPIGGFGAM